jgi:hypothetical protein
MRQIGIGALIVGALVVSLGIVFFVLATREYTECYGIFPSADAAGRAEHAAGEAGLGTRDLRREGAEAAVTFEFEETGDDGRQARKTFREIVEREGGRLGHPGNGCLELPRFGQ